jgi:hypothetical protein
MSNVSPSWITALLAISSRNRVSLDSRSLRSNNASAIAQLVIAINQRNAVAKIGEQETIAAALEKREALRMLRSNVSPSWITALLAISSRNRVSLDSRSLRSNNNNGFETFWRANTCQLSVFFLR